MHGRGSREGQGFAVDASVMEADASRYHGVTPEEADWSAPERQTRAVAEFLGALDDDDPTADRKPPEGDLVERPVFGAPFLLLAP
jgi:hypothetical protein